MKNSLSLFWAVVLIVYLFGFGRVLGQSAPTITTVAPGQGITMKVVSNGTVPLTYTWTFTPFNSKTPKVLASKTDTQTLPNVQPADAGTYSVTVKNAAGSTTAVATVSSVTVVITTG